MILTHSLKFTYHLKFVEFQFKAIIITLILLNKWILNDLSSYYNFVIIILGFKLLFNFLYFIESVYYFWFGVQIFRTPILRFNFYKLSHSLIILIYFFPIFISTLLVLKLYSLFLKHRLLGFIEFEFNCLNIQSIYPFLPFKLK